MKGNRTAWAGIAACLALALVGSAQATAVIRGGGEGSTLRIAMSERQGPECSTPEGIGAAARGHDCRFAHAQAVLNARRHRSGGEHKYLQAMGVKLLVLNARRHRSGGESRPPCAHPGRS